jgi:hypothetical protein
MPFFAGTCAQHTPVYGHPSLLCAGKAETVWDCPPAVGPSGRVQGKMQRLLASKQLQNFLELAGRLLALAKALQARAAVRIPDRVVQENLHNGIQMG